MNRVVPFAVEFVGLQIDAGKLFIRDLASDGVFAVIQATCDLQALGCSRPSNQPHHRLVISQRLTAPVRRDEGKQPVLYLVSFACARREMTDCQRQPRLIGQSLQLPFP